MEKNDVADAAVKALDNFKNPYDSNAANSITKVVNIGTIKML